MHVHFSIIWEEHEMRGSGRWLLCRVGVGGFGMCVYACARERLRASVCVRERAWDWLNAGVHVACLCDKRTGAGISALSWRYCLGLGGYFKGLLRIKDRFSILRSQPFIVINYKDCRLRCFPHLTTHLLYCGYLAPFTDSQETWFILWW